MTSNILNDQIKKQVLDSIAIDCSYTDARNETFEIYFRDGAVLIKAPFMRFKKLPDDFTAEILDKAGVEFESNIRNFDLESEMKYDDFWNRYYNNAQDNCPEANELNKLFNFPSIA